MKGLARLGRAPRGGSAAHTYMGGTEAAAAKSALRARATGPTREEAASAVKRRPEVGSELLSDVAAAVEAWMRQTRST